MPGIDLHVHSTASDGEYPAAEVARKAADAGLTTIALTDHDTLDGVADAVAAGASCALRVVAGCEFSVAARWGEMHLLGYFLPPDDPRLQAFLADQRAKRLRRLEAMVGRLQHAGVDIAVGDAMREVGAGAAGRPHVARALVERGAVDDVGDAFQRYLKPGRPGYVPKQLPRITQVTALVRSVGGVSSAAHLGPRGVKRTLEELRALGVDGVEVTHPAHDAMLVRQLEGLAELVGLLPTGGSDWHGDRAAAAERAPLGSVTIPERWLDGIEALHRERCTGGGAGT